MRIARLVLSLVSLTSGLYAKDPQVTRTGFKHLPHKYSYFDDSSTILYLDEQDGVLFKSSDDGATWDKQDIPDKLATALVMHPFNNEMAFVLGPEKLHFRTIDQGRSWQQFTTPESPSMLQVPLSFNAQKHESILFASEHCDDERGFWGAHCYDNTYYTKDAFSTAPRLLLKHTHSCLFAKSTKAFQKASSEFVLCIQEEESKQEFPLGMRLLTSEDWFKTETEVKIDNEPLRGVVGLGAVQTFIVAATKSPGTDEMALYVTDDGTVWDKTEFPHDHGRLKEDAYTILESRPYGIQVDVMSSEIMYNSFGSLFMSNSNGTYFSQILDKTNRNEMGIVDFENVENIQGIVLANIVSNHEEVQRERNIAKKLQSRISFDDGRTWDPLKPPKGSACEGKDAETCSLHLYSAASPHNVGRIFSSTVPGILMGVGSVGAELLPYDSCDLYVSEDAGLSWRLSKEGAHKYEWGDQGGILVAVFDEDSTDKLYYSFNRGRDWKELDLGMKIRARILTTVPDSTTERFTLVATRGKGETTSDAALVFSIDFTGMRSGKCQLKKNQDSKSDFEKWYARYDADGKPACLMGHKQYFYRKKADHSCYVGEPYHDPEPEEENCACTDADYECEYNFVSRNGRCEPANDLSVPPGACKDSDSTYLAPSGYRLIPGNTCNKRDGIDKTADIERPCSQPPADVDGITSTVKTFRGQIRNYFYLEASEIPSSDETVIMQLKDGGIYKSHNHGSTWEEIMEKEDIVAVLPHKYNSDCLYFLTTGTSAFVSNDRAQTFKRITLPTPPNNLRKPILDFKSSDPTSLLFTGMLGCDDYYGSDCRAVTYYTENAGREWQILRDYVDTCSYIGSTKVDAEENLIFCTSYPNEGKLDDHLELISTTNYFKDKHTIFDAVVGFAVFDEFIVVAEVHEGKSLRMYASVDGKTFAHGQFPPEFDVDHQQAYTVLDSVTKSIFLHITTSADRGSEWGSILKSNSNGTYFVTSTDYVNRNAAGYVDFEKLAGLEGVAIINTVSGEHDSVKKLRTKMTHNDGGNWAYLSPPSRDSEDKEFACSGSLDSCSLNFHGYTERVDIRDTYSSGSAVGILVAVGNVGSHLISYEDSNTFMSTDGGITWHEAHKGPYQWEFGDQGSIIVLVKDLHPTDRVLYTVDEGRSWQEYIFSDTKFIIKDISTVPSDTSRRFLLFGRSEDNNDKTKTIALDFSGLSEKKYEKESEASDFYLWTPSHPSNEDKCLFGHVAEYHRKRPEHTCFIGEKIPALHKILHNCTCSIYDFECDYNFERLSDGTCHLIPGSTLPDHKAVCADDNVVSWSQPTGYRRIPLTTCVGGHEFDKGEELPCPGKEKQFKKTRKGFHGFWLFVTIMIPFLVVFTIAYQYLNKWSRRGLGQIRLGDEGISTSFDLSEHAIVAVSAVITFFSAIPMILGYIYKATTARFGRTTGGVYNTASSFSRSGYTSVVDDVAGLLSDDEDL